MTERKYTVSEIDALRQAIRTKYLYGAYAPKVSGGASYNEATLAVVVEEQIRTAMLAGHTADDLYASERVSTP